MKLSKIPIIFFITIACISLSFSFFVSKIKIKSDIYAESIYIRYACNNCYPKYKIKSSNIERLINKDIFILLCKNKKEVDFIEIIDNQICDHCYIFKIHGDLYYSILNGHYTIIVEEYELIVNNDCCNESKKAYEEMKNKY